jgi:hypothetical protein
VIDDRGQEGGYQDPEIAVSAVQEWLYQGGKHRGFDGLEGVWESNAKLVSALREAGRDDLAELLHATRVELEDSLRKAERAKAEQAQQQNPTSEIRVRAADVGEPAGERMSTSEPQQGAPSSVDLPTKAQEAEASLLPNDPPVGPSRKPQERPSKSDRNKDPFGLGEDKA